MRLVVAAAVTLNVANDVGDTSTGPTLTGSFLGSGVLSTKMCSRSASDRQLQRFREAQYTQREMSQLERQHEEMEEYGTHTHTHTLPVFFGGGGARVQFAALPPEMNYDQFILTYTKHRTVLIQGSGYRTRLPPSILGSPP